jgi:hypothetical protein
MPTWNKRTNLIGALICVIGMFGNASWASAGSLIGTWATSESFGEVVDAGTGAAVRSSYSGQAYHFEKDGSFWHLFVGSGQIISGASLQHGVYEVKGNRLYVKPKTEDWTPNPSHPGQKPAFKNKPVTGSDEEFEFAFQGDDSLILIELPYKTRTTLRRTRKSP